MNNQPESNLGTTIITTLSAILAVTLIFSSPYLIWNTMHLASMV
jgi:hypothetical protein